jgi:hypothetical protein
MSSSRISRTAALISTIAAIAALALPAVSAAKPTPKPRVSTSAATHILGTSALLTGVINPNNLESHVETFYFFRWGLATACCSQTSTTPIAPGDTNVKVGQSIGPLTAGQTYHYELVAVNGAGLVLAAGKEHSFTTKTTGAGLAFVVTRSQLATYGSPFVLSGSLTGIGKANHKVALQASPFPYLEPFTTIGLPGLTNSAGGFSFRVANLTQNTQFRMTTLDPLPIYSQVISVDLRVRVALQVRSSGQQGVYRLYGTVAPAVKGAKVSFQVQKAVRPGPNEVTTKWVNQFTTVAKKNGAGSSRFSMVVTIRKGGRYRAYVKLPPGKLRSAASTTTVILHAAPASALRGSKG